MSHRSTIYRIYWISFLSQIPIVGCFSVSPIHTTLIDHPSSSSFAETFIQSKCWGNSPVLIRGVFQIEAETLSQHHQTNKKHVDSCIWPSWEDVKQLASNEDAESRWITHIDQDPTSWTLDLGPFDAQDVNESLSSIHTDPDVMEEGEMILLSTLIINDVDRFIPSLSKWIDDTFFFIPQWRKDDGQVSLAHQGGGIGPHVDEYDVFLIQMAGVRKWQLGKRLISIEEEWGNDFLVPELDVRIIQNWQNEKGEEFILNPGDVLYLPPRIAHCGTALTNGCMTLSVGLRAPSAREIIHQLAEYTSSCLSKDKITKRYMDPWLLNTFTEKRKVHGDAEINKSEITAQTKLEMKHLVREAINDILDDDFVFDEILCKFLTEPKRLRANHPMTYEGKEDLIVAHIKKIFTTGFGHLEPCTAVTFAHSMMKTQTTHTCRLFVDGIMWEISSDGSIDQEKEMEMVRVIASRTSLSRESFVGSQEDDTDTKIPPRILQLLIDLIQKGYLQMVD